jgi:hypothetical protein
MHSYTSPNEHLAMRSIPSSRVIGILSGQDLEPLFVDWDRDRAGIEPSGSGVVGISSSRLLVVEIEHSLVGQDRAVGIKRWGSSGWDCAGRETTISLCIRTSSKKENIGVVNV